ncbi:SagB/ThcOx family dehydrogenase [candidate division GN15 bacterium]|nr:SagB/ThcOx family dehydrogenase [candidate division GN15 bacterium]
MCKKTVLSLLGAFILLTCSQSITADTTSIGAQFHSYTSFGKQGGVKDPSPSWGTRVPLYKSYDDAPRFDLPVPVGGDLTVSEAINERRSIRSYADSPLDLEDLARLLLSANGLTGTRGGTAHRAAPSAGALYPIELYVIAQNVKNLPTGVYHFQPKDSSLAQVREGVSKEDVLQAGNQQRWVGAAPATFVITARFNRVTVKYSDRGYRYAYMECGMVSENIYLQAASSDLATVAVGAFNDDLMNELLGIDGEDEATLLVMPVGEPVGN